MHSNPIQKFMSSRSVSGLSNHLPELNTRSIRNAVAVAKITLKLGSDAKFHHPRQPRTMASMLVIRSGKNIHACLIGS
jgi:hypothetical protein